MEKLHNWTCNKLSSFGLKDSEEFVAKLLDLGEEPIIMKEYLSAMLDPSNSEHNSFLNEFIKSLSDIKSSSPGPGFYMKPELNNEDSKLKLKKDKKTNNDNNQKNSDPKETKKKSKYVSLYGEDGASKDVILLPGRHICNCQASKHKLINNCLDCGRIVCEQEGSGPCAFCKNIVVSKEEQEILNRGSKKSEALQNKLLNSKKLDCATSKEKEGLTKAIEQKNRLLEYDKTSEKRTKVYDDQNDYFQSGSTWLNPEKKEKLQKLEQEMKEKKYDKKNSLYTIDILGRKVLSDSKQIMDFNDPIFKDLVEGSSQDIARDLSESMHLLNLSQPIYVGQSVNKNKNSAMSSKNLKRIQDGALQEMSDDGMCMSMHQPYASLLVKGIKIHEGRTWYSSHRGRLWIASAAKSPDQSETSEIEEMYKVMLQDNSIKFPMNYPTSCLLGYVDVIDVLPQEEYRSKFPQGESQSPYVFICENPTEMPLKFPIKGEHKIYKLDKKIHSAAKRSLEK